jgi:hypothetical protein
MNKLFKAGVAVSLILSAFTISAEARTEGAKRYWLTGKSTVQSSVIGKRRSQTVSIGNNRGGKILRYAVWANKHRQSGKQVAITGSCDSACTLLLSLPPSQLCLGPRASFRFHSPAARSSRSVAMARSYMMSRYPGWVRSYVSRNGGMRTSRLVTMNHAYASRFIKSCATRVARR